MAAVDTTYVLDANVLIEAHRRYYGFDLCPGFWRCILHHSQELRVVSVDRVAHELAFEDELGLWASGEAGHIFASTQTPSVVSWYGKMVDWVNEQSQFMPVALRQFASVADGWIIAYAKAEGATVVTHEAHRPDARKVVPMPSACRAFQVECVDTFAMLRKLGARFSWRGE